MRRILWSNGISHQVVPSRHRQLDLTDATHSEFEGYTTPDAERVRQKGVRIERLAGRTRDKSRDVVRQSNGFVMSGWAKQTKNGVSHASRRLANQSLKKLVIG